MGKPLEDWAPDLQGNCQQCDALCCRDLDVRNILGLVTKTAGRPCRLLNDTQQCRVYAVPGTLVCADRSQYRCDGAGQTVSQVFRELKAVGVDEQIGLESFLNVRGQVFRAIHHRTRAARSWEEGGNTAEAKAITEPINMFLEAVKEALTNHQDPTPTIEAFEETPFYYQPHR